MSSFIQIGTTALRDPGTGDFLPAVPLYIKAEDKEKCQAVVMDGEALARVFMEKFRAYQKDNRKAKREANKKKAADATNIDGRSEVQR